MYKNKSEIIENIDTLMAQASKVILEKGYGLGIVRAYFAGGTLCLDVYEYAKLKYVILVNISTETFEVVEINGEIKSETKRLLPLKSLKTAFEIYSESKGSTPYFDACFSQSCIRFLEK